MPLPLSIPGGAVTVASGSAHSLALMPNGRVLAWGRNDVGQLGDGTIAKPVEPVLVAGLTDVIGVAAAGCHSLALRSDGSVWTWGYNHAESRESGIDRRPIRVKGLEEVVAVGASCMHNVAIRSDGSIWAWSDRGFGSSAASDPTSCRLPRQVGTLSARGSPAILPGAVPYPSHTQIHFGRVECGGESHTITLMITNMGLAPLVVEGLTIIGRCAEEFRVVGESVSGVEIYPGSIGLVHLQFAPLGRGRRTADLLLSSNGCGDPLRVRLSGFAPAVEMVDDETCGHRLKYWDQLAASIQFSAAGEWFPPSVEAIGPAILHQIELTSTLQQTFRVTIPVLVRVLADCPASAEPLVSEARFTITQVLQVRLPIATTVWRDEAEHRRAVARMRQRCAFTALQMVQIELPLEFGVQVDHRLTHLLCEPDRSGKEP